MRVILLKDVKGLGRQYDEKEVSEGYARNFLFLKKLAVPADEAHKGIKKAHDTKEKKVVEQIEGAIQKLKATQFIFKVKTGDHGEVFGSVGNKEIEKRLVGVVDVAMSVPAIHLKTLGAHEVFIKLTRGVEAKIMVELVADK